MNFRRKNNAGSTKEPVFPIENCDPTPVPSVGCKPKFVYYINISGKSKKAAEDYVNEIKEMMKASDNYYAEQWYFVPVLDQDSRIELLHL